MLILSEFIPGEASVLSVHERTSPDDPYRNAGAVGARRDPSLRSG
jgi:hypothetical protein